MKYSTYIDNITAVKWGLNYPQAALFDWIYTLPSWAEKITVEGKDFYFASKNKVCDELPLLTDKPDTVYRYYKQLEGFELIEIEKVSGRDFIHLTPKTAIWGRGGTSDHSEINPSKLGNTSESDSENYPTYKNTSNNKNIREKESSLFPEKKTLFKNSSVSDIELFKKKLQDKRYTLGQMPPDVNLDYYYYSVSDWSDSKGEKRTAAGWIATARQFMRGDQEKGKLKKLTNLAEDRQKMVNFLASK